MNKADAVTLLKAKLAINLEKQGSSLEEIEDQLTKEADGFVRDTLGAIGDLGTHAVKGVGGAILGALPELGIAGPLLAGTTLGGIGYAANRHLNEQDKNLNERRSEVERYKSLVDRIKSDYHVQ